MKELFNKYKPTFIILGGIVVLLAIIIIPTIIISMKKERSEYFPEYNEVKVNKTIIENKTSPDYSKLKKQLENDKYFAREALISNYNYNTYTSADLQNMVWNFIFSYELSNTRNLSSLDYNSGRFCMRSHYVIDGFKELYNVKITADIDLLNGFFEYVEQTGKNRYCFNFGNVGRDYNNEIKVAVEDLEYEEDEESDEKYIIANIYVYEYYTSGTDNEKTYIRNLTSYISNSNYSNATSIVENYLFGKVTHKQLHFKVNNNGLYFKYQILKSKNLSY